MRLSVIKAFLIYIPLLFMVQNCIRQTGASLSTSVKPPKSLEDISREDFSKISKDLTRGGIFNRGLIVSGSNVEVTPFTKPYIIASSKVESYKKGLSSDQEKKYIIKELKTDSNDGRSFFAILIYAPSYLQIKPEYIIAELIDNKENKFPLKIITALNKNYYSATTFNGGIYQTNNSFYSAPSYTVVNNTILAGFVAYVDTEIDFSKSFKIKMDLRYHDNSEPFILEWLDPEE